jgi:hypothetical protein
MLIPDVVARRSIEFITDFEQGEFCERYMPMRRIRQYAPMVALPGLWFYWLDTLFRPPLRRPHEAPRYPTRLARKVIIFILIFLMNALVIFYIVEFGWL